MSAAMEEYAALMMLGVRVRAVPDLAEDAIWCHESRVLFVDDDLPPRQRAKVVDFAIQRALSSEAEQTAGEA